LRADGRYIAFAITVKAMTGPLLVSPLVSTQWLADHLGSDDLVVLDATVLHVTQPNGRPGHVSGHEQYLLGGHLPGAVFADLIEVFSDPAGNYPFTRPTAEMFADAAGSVGITNESTVVVYDTQAGQWASRIWWLFRAFGYDSVAVLDGGYSKWTAEERETAVGHVEPTPTIFTVQPRHGLWVDKQFVESVVAGTTEAALVCGLPAAEFRGETGSRARLGHIPGSVSVPTGRLLNRETNALAADSDLDAALAPIIDERQIVAYCSGGIASALTALALTLRGHTNVAIYDGSLAEWTRDPDAPLTTALPAPNSVPA
jgi:thiosulfate/3-mercaptopyruvate sulfurtransferase